MQVGCRAAFGLGAHSGPDRLRNGRHVGQAFGQPAEIEARAADENDRTVAGLGEDLLRPPRPAPDRKVDPAVDFAEEAVRRLPLLRACRARSENPEVGIDLHRIGVDDRRAEAFRQPQRDRGLAARRRACDEERAPHRLSIM